MTDKTKGILALSVLVMMGIAHRVFLGGQWSIAGVTAGIVSGALIATMVCYFATYGFRLGEFAVNVFLALVPLGVVFMVAKNQFAQPLFHLDLGFGFAFGMISTVAIGLLWGRNSRHSLQS